jgi:hypothetical protein
MPEANNASQRDGAAAPPGQRLKTLVNWVFLIAAVLYSIFHIGFVIWPVVHGEPWITKIVIDHYAAIIGLPFAAFGALGLVFLLDSRSETPIEFKAIGFEFKGASAPIVLWVICFLAMAGAVKLLW